MNRRDFLKRSATAAAVLALPLPDIAAAELSPVPMGMGLIAQVDAMPVKVISYSGSYANMMTVTRVGSVISGAVAKEVISWMPLMHGMHEHIESVEQKLLFGI